MLLKLPPELLLLVAENLGHKSHWNLARTCATLWALLGSAASFRCQYTVFSISTSNDPNAITSKPMDHPLWQKGRLCIEVLKVVKESAPIGNPDPMFWFGRTQEDVDEGIQTGIVDEDPDDPAKSCYLPKLRALQLPIECLEWIPEILLSSLALNTPSTFSLVENLTISGVNFSFYELHKIFILPCIKHLRIEGPKGSWDSSFENMGYSLPKSSTIETLQLVDTVISTGSAICLIAACKSLKAFAYWQKRCSQGDNLYNSIWDSRAIIDALCEHQSQSLKTLSLQSESPDKYISPWTPIKRLSRLESLTCQWAYIMPDNWVWSNPSCPLSIEESMALAEILPPGLKYLRIECTSGLFGLRDPFEYMDEDGDWVDNLDLSKDCRQNENWQETLTSVKVGNSDIILCGPLSQI